MPKVIERAKMHFQPLRNNPRPISIPEWSDGEDDAFFATAINLKERQNIEKRSGDETEIAVEVIIKKLTDKNGNPVFTIGDKQDLMRSVCPRVIGRVARDILMEVDIEEAEKN